MSHSAREAVIVVQQFLASLASVQQVVNLFPVSQSTSGFQDYSLTFSLLSIGEIGRGADLSSLRDLKPAVLNAFGHSSEEVSSESGILCRIFSKNYRAPVLKPQCK